MAQSELEKLAIIERNKILAANIYNNDTAANNYGATHSRALSDNLTPEHGREPVGGNGDIGTSTDIYGNPTIPGSGRVNNLVNNQYNTTKPYTAPDESLNKGQVSL
jgi:hypothetical protein